MSNSIEKLTKINIHGPLKDVVGGTIDLDIDNGIQGLSALRSQYPGIVKDYSVLVDGEHLPFLKVSNKSKVDLIPNISGSGPLVTGVVALGSALFGGASVGVAVVSAVKAVATATVISGVQSLLSPNARARQTHQQLNPNAIVTAIPNNRPFGTTIAPQRRRIQLDNSRSTARLGGVGGIGRPELPSDSPGAAFSGGITQEQEGKVIPIVYGDSVIDATNISGGLSIYRTVNNSGNRFLPEEWTRGFHQWYQTNHYLGDGCSEVKSIYVDGVLLNSTTGLTGYTINLNSGTTGYQSINDIDYWYYQELNFELYNSSNTYYVPGLGKRFSTLFPDLGYDYMLTTLVTPRLYWLEDISRNVKGWSALSGRRFGYKIQGLSDERNTVDFTKEDWVQGRSIEPLIFSVDSVPPEEVDQNLKIILGNYRTLVANTRESTTFGIYQGQTAANAIHIPDKVRFYDLSFRITKWAKKAHTLTVTLKQQNGNTIWSSNLSSATNSIRFPSYIRNRTYRTENYIVEFSSTAQRVINETITETQIVKNPVNRNPIFSASGFNNFDVLVYKYSSTNYPQLLNTTSYPGQWRSWRQHFKSEYDIDIKQFQITFKYLRNIPFTGTVYLYKGNYNLLRSWNISRQAANQENEQTITFTANTGIQRIPNGKTSENFIILITTNTGAAYVQRYGSYSYRKVKGVSYDNFARGQRSNSLSFTYVLSEMYIPVWFDVYIPTKVQVPVTITNNQDEISFGSREETSSSIPAALIQDTTPIYINLSGVQVTEQVISTPGDTPTPDPILTNFDETSEISIVRKPENYDNQSETRYSALSAAQIALRIGKRFKSPEQGLTVKTQLDAQTFSNPSNWEFSVRGKVLKIPSNTTVTTSTKTSSNGESFTDTRLTFESGIWDGTFKEEVSSDPAWILYDLLTNSFYGLGEYITEDQIDKYSFYSASQYNNGLVEDSVRYRFDGIIGSAQSVDEVINNICLSMRANLYWGHGLLKLSQDRPTIPSHIITQANVIGGSFSYESSGYSTRSSVVRVNYVRSDINAIQEVYTFEDRELIDEIGYKPIDIDYVGQVHNIDMVSRLAKWYVYTQNYETEIVKFVLPLEGLTLLPGDIVQVSDKNRVGIRAGGRLKEGSSKDVLVLDDILNPEAFLSNPGSGTTWDSIEGLMDSWIGPFDSWTSGTNPILFDSLSGNIDDWVGLWDNLTSRNIDSLMNISVAMPNGIDTVQVKSVNENRVKLYRSLESDPAPWTIWTISNELVSSALYRVISVSEEADGTQFAVNALEYNPAKYSHIEKDTLLNIPSVSIYPYEKQIPEKVLLELNSDRSILTATFDPVLAASSYLIGYRISTELTQGQELTVEVTSTTYSWNYNLDPGKIWFVRVWAIFSDGSRSPISRNAEIAIT